jgi:glycerate kinase
MNIVIAPDSFKECLTAAEVARCIAHGIHNVIPNATIDLCPMADGGEGTADALVAAYHGNWVNLEVSDPLMKSIPAHYGILPGLDTAAIDMAEASGLARLVQAERNPAVTSTYGTGQLMAHALNTGIKKIIIGLGGSATNDGGMGMARALGYRFYDADGQELSHGGAELVRLASIDDSEIIPAIEHATILAAYDVNAPLTGPTGASMVYSPQKGADGDMTHVLEHAMEHYSAFLQEYTGRNVHSLPGSGAAGGLGAGLIAFAKASLIPGVELVANTVGLEEKIQQADWVITGEGRLDPQSIQGKVPVGVARIARKYSKPVMVMTGQTDGDLDSIHEEGISRIKVISPPEASWESILRNTPEWLEEAAAGFARELR